MGISTALTARLLFGTALAFLTFVAFAGAIAVPVETAAIRRWGGNSLPHRTVNALLYALGAATVVAIFYVAAGRAVLEATAPNSFF